MKVPVGIDWGGFGMIHDIQNVLHEVDRLILVVSEHDKEE